MKRTYKVALIAAIISVMMCGVAFAISQYYSVREHIASGNPSEAFEKAIVPVGQSIERCGVTMTLGDAVCDGSDLIFTLDIASEDNASPVYVYSELNGVLNGEPLDVFYDGFDFSSGRSVIIPSLNQDEQTISSHMGIKATLPDHLKTGTIDWNYKLYIYTPTGKLVADEMAWDWTDESLGNDKEYYHALYENGKIPVTGGNRISEDYLLTFTSGWDEYLNLSEREIVEKTGLFTYEDTIEFNFTTEVTEEKNLIKESVYPFEAYTVTVKSVSTSFMQVSYELEVVYDEPQAGEHELEQFYVLIDNDGNIMPRHSASMSLADDNRTCTVTGSVERISDAPLTSIIFRLDHESTLNQNDCEEDMPWFTVEFSL